MSKQDGSCALTEINVKMHSTSTLSGNSQDNKSNNDLERGMVSEITTITLATDRGPRITRPSQEQTIILSGLLLIFAFLCVVVIGCKGCSAIASMKEYVTGGDKSLT